MRRLSSRLDENSGMDKYLMELLEIVSSSFESVEGARKGRLVARQTETNIIGDNIFWTTIEDSDTDP